MSLEKIEIKLDKIVDKVTNIEVIMERNTNHLAEYMRRTELLEAQIEPIKAHVISTQGVIKFIGLLALVATIFTAIFKVL